MKHEDDYITVCCDCESEVENVGLGDESWTVCTGCRNVEQDTKRLYIDNNGDYTLKEEDV